MADGTPPLDPAALQRALSMGSPAARAGATPPFVPPPEEQQTDLNLGSSPVPKPKAQPGPPQQSTMPALIGMFHQVFGDQAARGYVGGTGSPGEAGAQPARPVSRLDAFENFVGNFLSSFSQGMSNAGTGPAANARGFGAAVQAPYQRELQQYQLGQQQQQVQAQTGLQEAEAQRTRAQATMTPVQPYGPTGPTIYLPPAEAARVTQSQITAQGKVQAAGLNRYVQGPLGVLDRQTGQLVGGTGPGGVGAMATVTPEMAKQFDIPQQYVGKQIKNSDLVGFMNAKSRSETIAQGSEGPSLVDKGLAAATGGRQGVTSLGIGSPAANPLAQAKFQVSSAREARTIETNQNQVNLAIGRLMNLRQNADVLTNMIDAGKIQLSMGGDGIIRAAIGRNAQLSDREKQFAADFQAMSEDINLLRLPQGGGGFRSEEAFEAMQAQRGRLYQNQGVFTKVLDNTIDSMRGVQNANQNALDAFYAANPRLRPTQGGRTSGAKPTPKANDPLGVL